MVENIAITRSRWTWKAKRAITHAFEWCQVVACVVMTLWFVGMLAFLVYLFITGWVW